MRDIFRSSTMVPWHVTAIRNEIILQIYPLFYPSLSVPTHPSNPHAYSHRALRSEIYGSSKIRSSRLQRTNLSWIAIRKKIVSMITIKGASEITRSIVSLKFIRKIVERNDN